MKTFKTLLSTFLLKLVYKHANGGIWFKHLSYIAYRISFILYRFSVLFLSTNSTVSTNSTFCAKTTVSHFFCDKRYENFYREKVFFVYRNSTVSTIRLLPVKTPVIQYKSLHCKNSIVKQRRIALIFLAGSHGRFIYSKR